LLSKRSRIYSAPINSGSINFESGRDNIIVNERLR